MRHSGVLTACHDECVYDQTVLVIIKEEFRALKLNSSVSLICHYSGISDTGSEGYDPESKG